jgi:DNA-directed RNA polymerase subunit M/transcription elongation factor TFIIS
MSIKFNCHFCQRSLKVNQELAGKKARCPGCKKVISIPTLQPTTVDVDVNVEEEAAAALAEQTATVAAPAKEKAPIKFQCRYCDEEVEVSGDLAGKQTPCPECRRIIKVPLSAKTEPKDWRKAGQRGCQFQSQPASPG